MKIVVYKVFNGELNLFKLRNGKIVHIETKWLKSIKEETIPDVPCYIQIKKGNDFTLPKAGLASIKDIKEYSIEEAVSFFNDSEQQFTLKDL